MLNISQWCKPLVIPGDKIVPSPGRGVGSNVTSYDLSDGIPRIAEGFTEGREKSESQEDFTEDNPASEAGETKGAI
jgi:hypothetical protein